MSEYRFLPGFRTAPGPNRALVQETQREPAVRFYKQHPDAHDRQGALLDLANKRNLKKQFGALALAPLPAMEQQPLAIDSWRVLRAVGVAWLGNHFADIRVEPYRSFMPADADPNEHAKIAGQDGLATNVAFLEVVPRALFRHEFGNPNAEIAQWARQSVGFMVEWLGICDAADMPLAWALASPKPRHIDRVFEDLHFNPSFFAAEDTLHHVGIDPLKAPCLRDHKGRQPQGLNGNEPLFGCPAAKMVPGIHQLLVGQAEAAGLFGQTYMEERANTGYPEAWAALGRLTMPQ